MGEAEKRTPEATGWLLQGISVSHHICGCLSVPDFRKWNYSLLSTSFPQVKANSKEDYTSLAVVSSALLYRPVVLWRSWLLIARVQYCVKDWLLQRCSGSCPGLLFGSGCVVGLLHLHFLPSTHKFSYNGFKCTKVQLTTNLLTLTDEYRKQWQSRHTLVLIWLWMSRNKLDT